MRDGPRELDDRLAGALALRPQEVAGGCRGASCQSPVNHLPPLPRAPGGRTMRRSIFARIEEVKERADDLYFNLILNSQKVRFFVKPATTAQRVPVYTNIDAPLGGRLIFLLNIRWLMSVEKSA